MINALVESAVKEKDHASFEMLQWFVKEQVEEEENASAILAQINMVGDVPGTSSVWITSLESGNNHPLSFLRSCSSSVFFHIFRY